MQMQQHNHIIILILKSMVLREPCSSSFINRMANRSVKYACGLLDVLSLILFSCTLLTHRSNSTGISADMLVNVKEESGFPGAKLSSSLSGKEHHLKCFGGYIHLKCSAEPALKNWYFLVLFEALNQLNNLKYIITEAVTVTARANGSLECPFYESCFEYFP